MTKLNENKNEAEKPYDELGAILAYEQGDLDETASLELFQRLVNSGLVWQLQGHYGRTAAKLIKAGCLTQPNS